MSPVSASGHGGATGGVCRAPLRTLVRPGAALEQRNPGSAAEARIRRPWGRLAGLEARRMHSEGAGPRRAATQHAARQEGREDRCRVGPDREERDGEHHLGVDLRQPADVPVDCVVELRWRRVLPLHLDRPQPQFSVERPGDDDVEALVAARDVDVPARVGQDAGHVHLGDVIAGAHGGFCPLLHGAAPFARTRGFRPWDIRQADGHAVSGAGSDATCMLQLMLTHTVMPCVAQMSDHGRSIKSPDFAHVRDLPAATNALDCQTEPTMGMRP